MKRYITIFYLAVFLVVLCGKPREEAKKETSLAGKDIAFGVLTENEIQRFLKAAPVFKTETEKKQTEWEALDAPEHLGSWLGQFSMLNKDIAQLDAKLTAAGMPWNDFWPALAKTMTAFAAVMYDSSMGIMKREMGDNNKEIAKMEAKLKDPKIAAQEKEMIKASLQMMKSMQGMLAKTDTIYVKVPQNNKDLVKKYMADLVSMFEQED